jgi:hypothetical protein
VTATGNALAQLNTLLDEYAQLVAAMAQGHMTSVGIQAMMGRFQAAISRLTVPTSTYGRDMESYRNSREPSQMRLTALAGIATALRDDIQAGWLESVVELAHADTYNGYLEMAEGLIAQQYKDAAAVIAGTSLEVLLKSLATKHGVSLLAPNGSSKKTDTLNADLKKASVYNALEQKQVTAWLGIRNSAAHGDYDDYDETAVNGLINGVRNFAAKYPA